MMRKNIFSVFMLLCLAPISLFAQGTFEAMDLKTFVGRHNWNKTINPSSAEFQGSPFLNEAFKPGEVYYDGKYKISDLPLRYNLHNDEIEYKQKNVIMAFADPNSIDKVVIGDQVFLYIKQDKKGPISGFVHMWNDRFPTILTKMKVDFFEKEEAKPYVDPKPARFERGYDKHFLMKSQNEIEKIVSVKKLIKSLGKHQSELSAFAKKEKISANDPDELAKLIDFFYGLD